MYENFFGFKEKPFSIIPDASYFYQSRQHRLALAQLEYGLLNRVGFIVISGDIGTGKTTLIRTLLSKLDSDINVASIFNTTVNPQEFLDLVLMEFGLEPGDGNHSDKLNTLKQFLAKHHEQGRKSLLIIDEAQNLSIETLEEIRLLSNMEQDKEYLLHIVLVGQTEVREKLMHPALSQLAQRIAVHYNLAPLSEDETESYIMYRLRIASANGEPGVVFAKEAIKAIYECTNGTPRLINVLCDLCLVYAYADELRGINLKVVEEVVKNQEASGFSSLFTARRREGALKADAELPQEKQSQATASINTASMNNDALHILEAKVADLQSGLIAVNRTVQDFLLEHSGRISRSQEQREEALNRAIDVQKVEIERLKQERKDLLKRIYELSSLVKEQESKTAGHIPAPSPSSAPNIHQAGPESPPASATDAKPAASRTPKRQRQPQKSGIPAHYWLWGGAAIAACTAAFIYEPWREKIMHVLLNAIPF
jgi:general secretion pathway protein A